MKRRYPLGKRVVARTVDALGAPLWALSRVLRRDGASLIVRRVLVVEIWKLGDIVLATPALRALRTLYPEAQITLLANPAAATLLKHTNLVDEILPVVFPWTAEQAKYDPRRYESTALRGVLKELRARRFDVALAARMDPRDHGLLAASGAPRRVGLAHGGGAFFLTDAIAADNEHRVTDWLRLVRHLGYTGPDPALELTISEDETAVARQWLASRGIRSGKPIVGIHAGAAVALRQWAMEKYATIAARAAERGAQVVLFEDPSAAPSVDGAFHAGAIARLPLREMLAVLRQCSMLVCNDSGQLHMAAALGVPTVGVFTNQRADWYAPRGDAHAVAQREGFACRPCFDRCVFAEPYCNTTLAVDDVWPLVERRLEVLLAG